MHLTLPKGESVAQLQVTEYGVTPAVGRVVLLKLLKMPQVLTLT